MLLMTLLESKDTMRGDLILFKSDGSFGDNLIAWGTHGPFVHVEIDEGNGQWLGANANGITESLATAASWVIPVASYTDLAFIGEGLAWARRQIGKPYGYIDIFDDSLKFFGIPITLVDPRSLDCSDYAARYLVVAHAAGPLGDLAQYPQSVSPNDLARSYKVN